MHMPALIFGAQNFDSLFGAEPTRTFWVLFDDEAGERLAYDQAYVQGQARVGARYTTRAVERHEVCGILQHDVAGAGVGDDLFQIGQPNILVDCDQLCSGF